MNDQAHFLFFGHGGSMNRGCEAIIRSSAKLMHDRLGDRFVLTVASWRKDEDLKVNIPYVDGYIDHLLPVEDYTINWFKLNVYRRIFR